MRYNHLRPFLKFILYIIHDTLHFLQSVIILGDMFEMESFSFANSINKALGRGLGRQVGEVFVLREIDARKMGVF